MAVTRHRVSFLFLVPTGLEGQLWGENIRSRDHLDYMLFPRLLALAERAWHKASWEDLNDPIRKETELSRDWNTFARNIGDHEFGRLDKKGVNYRLTPPGAMYVCLICCPKFYINY